MGRGTLGLLMAIAALLAGPAWAVARSFDAPASHDTAQQFSAGSVQRQDTPNDPDYDSAETDDEDAKGGQNLYDETFRYFGFPSLRTPTTLYRDPGDGAKLGKPQISGFNVAGAWKQTRGRPDVAVAILDTGIRWENSGLRTQVRLNRDELPKPAGANVYDKDGNGAFNVDDYKDDPRVKAVLPAGQALPTGRDLIHAFSDGDDADHNGYVDDIAGWDFFNDDNDPNDDSSYFAAANHGSGRAGEAVERGDDASGGLGLCPKCQVVPVRVWDTFVSDGDTFGLGILYATDLGVKVIEGADGSLYHSRFAEQASQYAYDKGVTQTFSGNDLNTGNHNYPANYDHVMEIQGTVPDTIGVGSGGSEVDFGSLPFKPTLGANAPVGSYFRGANTTQFGGHSSISMTGTTGSQNTGQASGAAALVISAALDRGKALTPDQTRILLEQTAEDVLPADTTGTGVAEATQTGWDSHFGYGRADVGRAVGIAAKGAIPPEASIGDPDWYAPLTGASATVKGLARADGAPFHWTLEWGAGLAPTAYTAVRGGASTGTAVTDFGTIDLAAVRAAVKAYTVPADPGDATFAPGGTNPLQQQFTVRVRVTRDGAPGTDLAGEDRKVLTALDDPTLRPAFPKRMGTGGEAPMRYADLDGDGTQELLVPLEDGALHAYEPDGSELAGWPVRTRTFAQAVAHVADQPGFKTVDAPLEPLRAVAVADLDADGSPEVIDTAGRHVYVWEADGTPRPGFPVSIDPALCRGEDQRQPLVHRKCGFLAGPSVARLGGQQAPPSIVAPALDGHVYAFTPAGATVPGYPVDLSDPGMPAAQRMLAESINEVAVGDLTGDGKDDIVAASNESYGANSPGMDDLNGAFAAGLADLLANAAGGSTRVYAIDGATGRFLDGWPIKLNGAIQDVLPLVGPGHSPSIVKVGGAPVVVVSATGGALSEYDTAGKLVRSAQQAAYGASSDVADRGPVALNLFESASIGDVTGQGKGPDIVKYQLTTGQLVNLAAVGQNQPYSHAIGAFDAATGVSLPAFPRVTDDYQFLSGSTIAKVDQGSPANQVVAGTGLGLLHAYDGVTGLDAPGFPKVTGGWLYAPAALSDDGRIAGITREGFLFEWAGAQAGCQGEWPSFRHDPRATGDYDADGTAPGAPLGAALTALGGDRYRLRFTSPGDDGRCGTPARYLARTAGGAAVDLGAGAPVAGGTVVERDVTLPAGTATLVLRADDEAANPGLAARVAVPASASGGSGGVPVGGQGSEPLPPGTGGSGSAGTGGSSTGGGTGTSTGGGTGTSPGGSAGTAPGLPAGCRDTIAPTARIRGSARRRARLRTLTGTATDRGCAKLASVNVSVGLRLHKACRYLRANGTFGPRASCDRTRYLRAKGTARWTLRTAKPLPKGRYQVWVRAIDRAGNVERKQRTRNRLLLRLR